ncbi:hypothetical protein GGR59_000383 [Xanthomonas arboricola]|uniref:hypothetical protein n=1 Tax=Xanthomonas arboricola TaxID=56448 RepID=UPI001616E1B6|nr:hypothetical protein [Xanthomonas arboricola]MBB4604178.1 hypothetical protein [Xanthomonas arboricola]
MNEQSGNSGKLQAAAASGGDAPIDVTDPWRGLYRAERLRANGDGDLYHPDLPSWPDHREDALDKLVHAQGFDFQIVAGEFSDEATEEGGELYWKEMRAWNPEAPEGDWRLAWKGDTEDGPYAWFVRPMALRPAPEALTAGEPVGQEPAMYADTEFRQAQSAEYMAMGRGSKEGLWPRINAKYIVPLYTAPPAPAAVPVDVQRDAERIDAIAREYWRLDPIEIPTGAGDADVGWRVSKFVMPNRIQFVAEAHVDDLRQAIDAAMLATHPQPAAAKDGA